MGVVGTGLNGLCAALALSRRGFEVVVFGERVAGLDDPRGVAVNRSGVWMLERLVGALEGTEIREIVVREGTYARLVTPPDLVFCAREIGSDSFGRIVTHGFLMERLWRAVRASPLIDVRLGALVRGVRWDSRGVWLESGDGREESAPLGLLVGADGRDSTVRRLSGIGARRLPYRQSALVCVMWHRGEHRGRALESFYPGGPFALLPMSGRRSNVVWSERTSVAEALMSLPDSAFAGELSRRLGSPWGSVERVGPRRLYPLDLVHATRYARGRVVLVGDAAHGIHPIAGQGFNLGLRDIGWLDQVLSERLALGLDVSRLGGDWLSHRIADAGLMVGATDVLNRLYSKDSVVLRGLRRFGTRWLSGRAMLKRVVVRQAMGELSDLPGLMRPPGEVGVMEDALG